MSLKEMVMGRQEWLMDEDKLEGRRTYVLTVLDESGQPIDVIEGIKRIQTELEKHGGDNSKSKV